MGKDEDTVPRSASDDGAAEAVAAAEPVASAEATTDRHGSGEAAAEGTAADAAAEPGADMDEGPDLGAEVAALQDQLLRKQADFENFRRRLHRDKDEAIRYANTEMLLDLAEVIDGLERAVQTGAEADAASLRDGVSLIEKQLTGMLERKWGFCRFSSVGEAFDPQRHQAIASEESAEHEVATVVEDYQRGYLLHDRVVRPARVKVAQPSAGAGGDAEPAEDAAPAHTTEAQETERHTKEGT